MAAKKATKKKGKRITAKQRAARVMFLTLAREARIRTGKRKARKAVKRMDAYLKASHSAGSKW
jgi:2-methylisocitrate lyase-like PEP mutase family enzyme